MKVLLRAGIVFSAVVLVMSAVVHLSTFCGVDPMAAVPGVMVIHVLIFPPFIGAIFAAQKAQRRWGCTQQQLFGLAPRWLKHLLAVLGGYALINFVIFFLLTKDGGPSAREGKYFLTNHGHT